MRLRTHRRLGFALATLLTAATVAAIGPVGAISTTTGKTTHPRHGRGYVLPGPPPHVPAYDLVNQAGTVASFGGAGFFGDASKQTLNKPIVGGVSTADGKGYWLVASDGGIFTYGDAKFYGSAGGIRLNSPVVGMATTADGQGYWLVAADGGIFTYGDAKFYGSAVSSKLTAAVVAMTVDQAGTGYWIATASGQVVQLGSAADVGSLGPTVRHMPIVGIAADRAGKGCYLVASDGGVFTLGGATFEGSASGQVTSGHAAGMAVTPDGLGYWITTSTGSVLALGDAPFRGDLVNSGPQAKPGPQVAIAEAMAVVAVPASPYPGGSIGYDINWPQCSGPTTSTTVPLPGPPSYPAGTMKYSIAIVGVDGWAVDDTNPCLAAEIKWAKAATNTGGAPYDLYMLLNAPASDSTIDQSGPAGTCSKLTGTAWERCLAYNYGWNSAIIARQYAATQGAASPIWWLDIENTNCSPSNFNGGGAEPWSCDTSLNDLTIQGSIDYLKSVGETVGIYCTSQEWAGIAGSYVPPGPPIPIWIAGAYWTSPPYPASFGYWPPSSLAPYCSGGYDFAGGSPWMLQETPGSNNYPFDPDYSCG